MSKKVLTIVDNEHLALSLSEFCRTCGFNAEEVFKYIEYFVIEPDGQVEAWRFNSICIRRAQKARRLQRDLGINAAGVALALDLLDEIEQLRARLQRYEG